MNSPLATLKHKSLEHKRAIAAWHARNERLISPAVLIAGFLWDSLTLKRVDFLLDNAVIVAYLVIAAASIALLNTAAAGKIREGWSARAAGWLPFVLQFCFGGLFSAFVIFYSRSASIVTSWPFLFMLAALFIGNETFRGRYQRLTFQISIFFIALFSYAAFAVPVVIGKIGAAVFIASGLTSLLAVILLLGGLSRLMPRYLSGQRTKIAVSIAAIYITFNVFYFLNIIPPIPLALKSSGVYHSVRLTAAGYEALYEPAPWYQVWRSQSSTVHWQPGSPVYVFSAIFAPTKISTRIFHRWMYFDKEKNAWVERGRLSFPVTGGRDEGYRGYTVKYGLVPGWWRVDVITERGSSLGTEKLRIVTTETKPELKKKILD